LIPAADIALLTERRFEGPATPGGHPLHPNILLDDRLLDDALRRRGLSSVRVDWACPDIDWSEFRCAVFRTIWDYFERTEEFSAWLARVERQTTLCNSPETVRWNMDKHYFADLEAKGIPVVATRYLERGATSSLRDAIDESGWADTIVKPCVSGGARHTYRVNAAKAHELEPIVRELLSAESLLLQPFIEDVARSGEDTLMVIDGRYTHAVRKVPKAGDFRVQEHLGGTVHDYTPTREQIELAERTMAAWQPRPAYGRVDMVRDNEGRLAVMELEVIEPELWLRHHPPAAEALAEAIAKSVDSK
jgi:glutathione synthase/RimK-type ligase-like ATP-grasp enzyme